MNFCWFYEQGCTIDYAAWWQAFGSIAAIIYAGRLAQSSERQKEADNYKVTQILLLDFKETLQSIIQTCAIQNEGHYLTGKPKFKVMLDQTQQIDFRYLPYSAAVNMTVILRYINEIYDFYQIIPYQYNWQHLHGKFETYFNDSERPIAEIMTALRPYKWWNLNREKT
ncbi:MAG: hypothetical protein ACAH07_05875 [Methylophilaceae bacterium]|nr:hypothetical protein [Methyloradius sp.]